MIRGAWKREMEVRLPTTALMEKRMKLKLVVIIKILPITLTKTLV